MDFCAILVPPNAPSLITSISVLFGLLLIPINKHLKVAPFALNIYIFSKE